jgi:hypothetical protein
VLFAFVVEDCGVVLLEDAGESADRAKRRA